MRFLCIHGACTNPQVSSYRGRGISSMSVKLILAFVDDEVVHKYAQPIRLHASQENDAPNTPLTPQMRS